MSNVLEYKGYIGSIEFSEEDEVFYGKVQGIRSLISYEGENARALIEDFHNAVDDYLALCKARETEPEKAYKGTFNIRISPELHKSAAIYAYEHKVSLNSVVESALSGFMSQQKQIFSI
ncbi:MAG: type II toxin-antitoxin system HicB family antitoxin [Lachnospiraceae bacterium]|nr:type II toxin-antitoxin system HicB family antitoxin [Lachnospiraceae bacterium]